MAKYLLMLAIALACFMDFSDSKPAYQMLIPKQGYIPVFIRYGDTPLEDINPLLAEAFGEHDIKARNIKTDNIEAKIHLKDTDHIDSKAHGENIIKDLPNSTGVGINK